MDFLQEQHAEGGVLNEYVEYSKRNTDKYNLSQDVLPRTARRRTGVPK